MIKVEELINMRKCDMKDSKKKATIYKIVLFAFQEALKSKEYSSLLKEGKASATKIIRMETFRDQVM